MLDKYANANEFYFHIFLSAVDAAQQFEKQPEYSEVNPGQESRLTCKIFNKKGQCSWQKDNKVNLFLCLL